jgi:uncharacterized protein (TIGR03000 family)
MRNGNAATARWWKKLVGGALALLCLAGTGLPNSWAQLEYNGGFVQTRREDGGSVFLLPTPQYKNRFVYPYTPQHPDPDQDFYYPIRQPAATSMARSYYYTGDQSGSPVSSSASQKLFGISAAILPWNQADFKDYREFPETVRDRSLVAPRKYSLEAIALSQKPPACWATFAVLVAHLPEHALFWVEGVRTRSTGRTRFFESPPLRSGRKYSYPVRAAWIEDGHWVSQSQKIAVQAGMIEAIYLRFRSDPDKSEPRR